MEKFISMTKRFSTDETGAAMVEYSILIGIITVASIAAITAVGAYVSGNWGALQTALAPAG